MSNSRQRRIEVVCELSHGHRAVSGIGVAVRAQIGHDDPIARGEVRHDGVPEAMVQRKRMQQHHRRPAADDFVEQLGIAAANCSHARASRCLGDADEIMVMQSD